MVVGHATWPWQAAYSHRRTSPHHRRRHARPIAGALSNNIVALSVRWLCAGRPAASYLSTASRLVGGLSLLVYSCLSGSASLPLPEKLDPIEAYIPVVILSQLQFKDLEMILEEDNPKYSECRSLLRSGPASSLRVNIRAVAQYAADDGKGEVANDAVDKCLGALEELDSLFLHASRNEAGVTVGSMKEKLLIVVGALDSLLQTVPTVALEKGKAIANAYFHPSSPSNESNDQLGNSDPELRQLESIL